MKKEQTRWVFREKLTNRVVTVHRFDIGGALKAASKIMDRREPFHQEWEFDILDIVVPEHQRCGYAQW